MTKKYIYILFILLIVTSIFMLPKEEKTMTVFNDSINTYDKYTLHFNECELNTFNFNEVFSSFYDKEYKILEIIPYIKESNQNIFNNKKFLYYSNDLNYILNDFKEKYTNIMLDNGMYVTNICIKNVIMYTYHSNLNNFTYNSTK